MVGLTSCTAKITRPAPAEERKVTIFMPLYAVAAVVVDAAAAAEVVEVAVDVVADMIMVEMPLS